MIREPFSIRYRQPATGREHTYTPDFLVQLVDAGQSFELLVEVKREEDLARYGGRSRAAFAAAQCWANEYPHRKFAMATDRWMQRAGLDQLRMLHAFSKSAFTAELCVSTVALLTRHPSSSTLMVCQHIGESLGKSWNEAMPIMLALVAAGHLTFDVTRTLTLETAINVGTIACPLADLIAADGPPEY